MKSIHTGVAVLLFLTASLLAPGPVGAATGPYLVKDINPSGHSFPDNLTPMGGKLYFTAQGGGRGIELWTSDGTSAGTKRVKDIRPGSASSNPSHLAVINGLLYFNANDGTKGYEPWVSDGTGPGTRRVKDIRPGAGGSQPFSFTEFNGAAYFSADDGITGPELWRTNGTELGTWQVKDIEPGPEGSYPWGFVEFAGKLVFMRTDCPTDAPPPGSGDCLYKTDGTAAGTKPFKDHSGHVVRGFFGGGLKVVASRLFFVLDEAEIWSSKGGSSTLRNLGAFGPWEGLVGSNGNAFFSVGGELWTSNGTTAGTVEVADLTSAGGIGRMVDVNGTLFLTAGNTLYKSDGTEGGTVEIYSSDYEGNAFLEMSALGSTLYYAGPSSTEEGGCLNPARTLWQSDGTLVGTFEVSSTPSNCQFERLTPVGDSLYFAARDETHGFELWRYVP